MKALKIGESPLALNELYDVAVRGRKVEISESSQKNVKKSHEFLQSELQSGKIHYGVNTGFGSLSHVRIPSEQIELLQFYLLRSHSCGVGPSLDDKYVRCMMLLRAQSLALGYSGVRLELIERLLDLLNHQITPVVPEQGSVGASGDLAPLAHLSLVLIGEGRARFKGKEMDGAEALRSAGLEPIRLGPKEGLALINGTQFMTALGSLGLLKAEYLCNLADIVGAMSLEALRGSTIPFDSEIHAVRSHPGQLQVAANLRKILQPHSKKSEIAQSHENCGKVQDPYSIRCMPQIHGASRDAIAFVRQVFEREINSVTDNPLVFQETEKILSGGNFHGQVVALALDMLAIAVSEMGSVSEQRISKLLNPTFSGLPPFLTRHGGLNSGFMMAQVTAASLVSENKTLCHPASVDSIPTSADKEDHVSMGAWAARKALKVLTNVQCILGLELMIAAQGIDLLRPLKSSEPIEKLHKLVRDKVAPLEEDRALYKDIAAIEELLSSDAVSSLVDLKGKQ